MSTRPGTKADAGEESIFKPLQRRWRLVTWIVAIVTAGAVFTTKYLEKADKTDVQKVGDRLIELNNRWASIIATLSEKADSKLLSQTRDEVRDLTIEVGILKKSLTPVEPRGVAPLPR